MNSAQDTPDQVRGGLPHSEIPGSPIARISPGLFAACRVLHRLSVPRHPPDALLLRLIPAFPQGNAVTPPRTGAKPQPRVSGAQALAKAGAHGHSAASHEDTSSDRRTALAAPS